MRTVPEPGIEMADVSSREPNDRVATMPLPVVTSRAEAELIVGMLHNS
jgi:hypothetical protein